MKTFQEGMIKPIRIERINLNMYARKYGQILQGGILDIGANECGLRKFLTEFM